MGFVFEAGRDRIVGASPPPPGIVPNFENPDSQGHRIILTVAILFPLATMVLVLRVYTRKLIVRNFGTDDYAIIFAWILSLGYITTLIILTHLGLGMHIWDVPMTTYSPHFLKLALIHGVFYGMSFMFVKLSILLLYLRLSPYRSFRIAVWIVVATTVLYSFLGSFQFLFNCQPMAKNWDATITTGRCVSSTKILLTHGSINIATDVAVLVLPIALVRKLKLPTKEKVALAAIFMAGTLVCIVSCIRLKTIMDLVYSLDFTWTATENAIWSIIEVFVGIICACLSSFKPFLRRHFPGVIGRSNPSTVNPTQFGTKTANVIPRTLTDEYELDSSDGLGMSGIPRKNKLQTGTDNESQEDILGDGFLKGIPAGNETGATVDVRPFSHRGSLGSDRSIFHRYLEKNSEVN